jgi:hypothetical protein
MILSEKVEVAINSTNIKEYSKLFDDIKMKNTVTLKPIQLMKGSHVVVLTSCDICGKEKNMEYRTYYKITNGCAEKYYCQKCSKEKWEKTNLERYGYIYPQQNQLVKDKIVQTNIERYGVEHSSQLEKYKIKQKNTNNEKYGVDTPLQDIELMKNGMMKKYGVKYPIQNDIIKAKIKKTNFDRNGFDNALKNREKIKKTNLERYGFENPMQNKRVIEKNNNTKRLNFLKKYENYNILEYDISKKILKMECDKNHIYEINYDIFKNRIKLKTKLCTICYPISSYSNSGYEIQLQDFIKENYKGEISLNNRKIVGKEIDEYLPELKLAFEFNGLFWHSEFNISNNYHFEKTELCEKENIHLIHIYEDDWLYKQDIVKSRILNLLGKSDKIFARKCEIKEITDNKLVREFLEKNHLQGFVGSKVKIGLFYNGELVSLMTFGSLRKPMGQKSSEGSYEMLRFCNKLNINVIGGASRLFKYFIDHYKPKEVISYADRSWSTGDLYEKLGFQLVHKTQPNYYYIIDSIRKHRFGFRKDKLLKEGADPNKTEHEIMLERKIFRIYDSGNLKYLWS